MVLLPLARINLCDAKKYFCSPALIVYEDSEIQGWSCLDIGVLYGPLSVQREIQRSCLSTVFVLMWQHELHVVPMQEASQRSEGRVTSHS